MTEYNKTPKDAQTEAVGLGAPGVSHPDKVFGDTVFRWTGKLSYKQAKTHEVTESVKTMTGVRILTHVVDDGVEETPFAGVCAICGMETYVMVEGENGGAIGEALAVFAPAGRNEPPIVYCQAHDPGKEHRSRGKAMLDSMDGIVVRLH